MQDLRCTPVFLLLLITALAAVGGKPQTPNSAVTHLARGKASFAKGDFAAAIDRFSKAIELKPDWAQAYVERGLARRMHGDLDRAIDDFNEATRLDTRSTQNNAGVAQAYTNHGQILATRFELDDAITDFDTAIKLFSGDLRPYYERAQARLLLEDLAGALADYDTYIAKEKFDTFGRARAHLERAFAKRLLGREREAEEDAKTGLKLAGKDADILLSTIALLEERLAVMRQMKKPGQKRIG
ncbi:MAG TPA: tetratricopeptide repeat protein [Pyrinomonadaceae bacterium]